MTSPVTPTPPIYGIGGNLPSRTPTTQVPTRKSYTEEAVPIPEKPKTSGYDLSNVTREQAKQLLSFLPLNPRSSKGGFEVADLREGLVLISSDKTVPKLLATALFGASGIIEAARQKNDTANLKAFDDLARSIGRPVQSLNVVSHK